MIQRPEANALPQANAWRRGTMTAALAVALLTAACGDSSDPTAKQDSGAATADALSAELQSTIIDNRVRLETFVGTVSATNAYVAITVKDGAVRAYFCDGEKIGSWLKGTLDGSDAKATNAAGASLTATATGDSFQGTVTIAGAAHDFTATKASYPAGLWEGYGNFDLSKEVTDAAAAELAHFGWIVLPDGSQRGSKVQQTSVSSAGTLEPDAAAGSDGTAAAPSTPPPTTATPTSAEMANCGRLSDNYRTALKGAVGATDGSLKEAFYITLMGHFGGLFFAAGCDGIFGSIT